MPCQPGTTSRSGKPLSGRIGSPFWPCAAKSRRAGADGVLQWSWESIVAWFRGPHGPSETASSFGLYKMRAFTAGMHVGFCCLWFSPESAVGGESNCTLASQPARSRHASEEVPTVVARPTHATLRSETGPLVFLARPSVEGFSFRHGFLLRAPNGVNKLCRRFMKLSAIE